MKKILSSFLAIILLSNGVFAATIKNIEASFTKIPDSEYQFKTVKKHYKAYKANIKNVDTKPVLMSSLSKITFITPDNQHYISQNRRTLYRKSRKRDMGRYYWFALPGAIIAGGITGITFFIGAPLGAAIYVGMYLPTDKAVRTNVKISQEIFNQYPLPIRLEPQKDYTILILAPKDIKIDKIVISNMSYDLKNMYDLEIREKDL